jgi:hypothetical protein
LAPGWAPTYTTTHRNKNVKENYYRGKNSQVTTGKISHSTNIDVKQSK